MTTNERGPGLLDPTSWNMDSSLDLMYSLVYGDELADLADVHDDILCMTADLATSNRMSDFQRRHPDRFVDVGIAERNMTSMAAGLATCGYRVYISTFASFAGILAAENVRTDLAYPFQPVRILAHHAGISFGFYGTSHHATEDIAITRAIADLCVTAPCDANTTRAILRSTLDEPGPVYIRLGRGREKPIYEHVPDIARGRFLCPREGTDVTIIATGIGVQAAVEAHAILAEEGISARVLDAVWLKPLDVDAVLAAARETSAIITVEDHNVMGGLGTAVAEVLADQSIRIPFMRHGIMDEYALIGPPTHLWRHYGIDGPGVAARVRETLAR